MPPLEQRSKNFLEDKRSARLESYRSSPEDISAHYSDEGQIQSDYHKRFAFELIQNADDAMQDVDGKKKVLFELIDGVLLVANTGRPIDREDVKSLCTMSYTTKNTKDEKRASIGHKGRGFSSVLEISNKPQIFSTGISFEFDKERSRKEIRNLVQNLENTTEDDVDGIPLMRLPFEPKETPPTVEELLEKGYNTVFRFKLKDEKVKNDVITTLNNLDQNTVLFLQELEQLEISLNGDERSLWNINRKKKRIESEKTDLKFVEISQISGNEIIDKNRFALFSRKNVEIGEHTGGIDENTWGEVNYSQIGLALQIEEQNDGIHLTRLEEYPSIHVFLPTEEKSPIPVLINGAFHTAISRTNIHVASDEGNYNGFLLQQVASLLATDVRKYSGKTATTIEELIEWLDFTHIPSDQRENQEKLRGRFIKALKNEVATINFIPRLSEPAKKNIQSNSSLKSIKDVVVPYHPSERKEIAEEVARIYGKEKLDVDGLDKKGWFPKKTLLEPDRADILQSLGSEVLNPEELPIILGSVANEASPIYKESQDELAIDPILRVLIWTWETIRSEDDTVEQFKNSARDSAVFPIGEPNENGVVTHVAKTDDADFFFPREKGMLDIQLEGLYFLSRPLYRPKTNVSPKKQKKLRSELKPALESIWDVKEFQFERAAQSAIFTKLPGQQQKTNDEELRDFKVLDVIHRMASESVNPHEPLPYTERRRKALYRMCLLPVPTKSGKWRRAYKVYFGKEWQEKEEEPKKVENLLNEANIDAPYLASPENFPGLSKVTDQDERKKKMSSWKKFFQWIGVSGHIRLMNLYGPEDRRYIKETEGIKRPKNSLLSNFPESDWNQYQSHLKEALQEIQDRGSLEHIYNVQSLEFYNQLIEKANKDKELAKLLFNHIASWWNERLRNFQHPVLASHDKPGFHNRSSRVFFEREKKEVGTNLWLWQLKQSTWCPSNQGVDKPENIWLPTESVKRRFEIEGNILLPVLSESVHESASKTSDLLKKIGIRQQVTQRSFHPEDAKRGVENIATIFKGEDDETISDYLRQIKPVYRYVSELSPSLRQNRKIQDEEWVEARSALENVKVLCRIGESEFEFQPAKQSYFVRRPDVLERIPVKQTGVPIFVLQEEDAIALGSYFGMKDLENEVNPNPDFINSDEDKTENLRSMIQNIAPFILCRLEAERGSQDLINEDTTGMSAFIETLEIVDKIRVDYQFQFGSEEKVISHEPDYFLTNRNRQYQERPKPFIKSAEGAEQNRYLARALCEFLQVSHLEGVTMLLNAETEDERRRYLKLAGAPSSEDEIQSKQELLKGDISKSKSEVDIEFGDSEAEIKGMTPPSDKDDSETAQQELKRKQEGKKRAPNIYDPSELELEGNTITIKMEPGEKTRDDEPDKNRRSTSSSSETSGVTASYRSKVDRVGMQVTIKYEQNRLEQNYDCKNPKDYVFNIHNEELYRKAKTNDIAGPVLENLEEKGLPELFPGFDILVVNPKSEKANRLIELKSSVKDTRKPEITWNEWKTARDPVFQDLFYLYIVGNLSKDNEANPYLKQIPNPFQLLRAKSEKRKEIKKAVNIDLNSFKKEAKIKKTQLTIADTDT